MKLPPLARLMIVLWEARDLPQLQDKCVFDSSIASTMTWTFGVMKSLKGMGDRQTDGGGAAYCLLLLLDVNK